MKKEEIIKKYGKFKAKKIFNKMKGQTTAIADDGSEDFYESDITKVNKEIEEHKKSDDFD